jgi:hypothetical protein
MCVNTFLWRFYTAIKRGVAGMCVLRCDVEETPIWAVRFEIPC